MWRAWYVSEWQSVWAVVVVPLLFLAWRAWRGERAPLGTGAVAAFVDRYAIVFACETVLDALATTPLSAALGIADRPAGTALAVAFVLLGDFRVYLLVFALPVVAAGGDWRAAVPRALGWTLVTPLIAAPASVALRAVVPGLEPTIIWLVYELTFLLVVLVLRARLTAAAPPALRGLLAALLGYAALYYALWAGSDVLIQFADLDAGWLLRMLPNQLYYAWWVPFVLWRTARALRP